MNLPKDRPKRQELADTASAARISFAKTGICVSKDAKPVHPTSFAGFGIFDSTPSTLRQPRIPHARLPFFFGQWTGNWGFPWPKNKVILTVRRSQNGEEKWREPLRSCPSLQSPAWCRHAIPTPTCKTPELVPRLGTELQLRPAATLPQALPSERPPARSRTTPRRRSGNIGTARAIAPGPYRIQVIGASCPGGLSFCLNARDRALEAQSRQSGRERACSASC